MWRTKCRHCIEPDKVTIPAIPEPPKPKPQKYNAAKYEVTGTKPLKLVNIGKQEPAFKEPRIVIDMTEVFEGIKFRKDL